MGEGYLSTPLIFLAQVVFGLYALVALLRFLLQLVRADFYNPLSQFIVRITSPALVPLRRIIPPVGGRDTASLVLAWLVLALQLLLIFAIAGQGFQPLTALFLAIPELIGLAIDVFLYSIFILVIISWINPGSYNPAISILEALTYPLMAPARRLLPPIGGLDLSPMLVMIGLVLSKMLLIPPLKALLLGLL